MANIEVIKTNGTAITKPARLFDPTATLANYGGDWATYRAAMEAAGKDFWLPVVRNSAPTYDSATHHAPVALAPDIQAVQVVYGWAAPVAKTAQEIDDDKTNTATGITLSDHGKATKLNLQINFELFKRVRALEGAGAQTWADFVAAIGGLPAVTDQQFIDEIKKLI